MVLEEKEKNPPGRTNDASPSLPHDIVSSISNPHKNSRKRKEKKKAAPWEKSKNPQRCLDQAAREPEGKKKDSRLN
jgi:hypothetical protein